MLYLASQSPRRRELLAQIGVAFSTLNVDIPEQREPGETPQDYVHRVAREKARTGLAMLDSNDRSDAVVLGADTEVVLDGDVFGKPRDAADAVAMLQRLAGRTHEVMSAVWLVRHGREKGDICVSHVRFTSLDELAVRTYVASEEPFGKAGAYAIQGRGATLVEHLEGSYSGVMGLPLFETACLLRKFDLL
jgi:septum formation protein